MHHYKKILLILSVNLSLLLNFLFKNRFHLSPQKLIEIVENLSILKKIKVYAYENKLN